MPNNQGPALDHRDDDALDAKQSAAFVGLALVTFWRQVSKGALPPPFYPSARSPRWRRSVLRRACEAATKLPAEAKQARHAARQQAAQTKTKDAAPKPRAPKPEKGSAVEPAPTTTARKARIARPTRSNKLKDENPASAP